jgi:hypothetical protein
MITVEDDRTQEEIDQDERFLQEQELKFFNMVKTSDSEFLFERAKVSATFVMNVFFHHCTTYEDENLSSILSELHDRGETNKIVEIMKPHICLLKSLPKNVCDDYHFLDYLLKTVYSEDGYFDKTSYEAHKKYPEIDLSQAFSTFISDRLGQLMDMVCPDSSNIFEFLDKMKFRVELAQKIMKYGTDEEETTIKI